MNVVSIWRLKNITESVLSYKHDYKVVLDEPKPDALSLRNTGSYNLNFYVEKVYNSILKSSIL